MKNADRTYAAEDVQQNIGRSRRSFRFETLVEFIERRDSRHDDQSKKPPAPAKFPASRKRSARRNAKHKINGKMREFSNDRVIKSERFARGRRKQKFEQRTNEPRRFNARTAAARKKEYDRDPYK